MDGRVGSNSAVAGRGRFGRFGPEGGPNAAGARGGEAPKTAFLSAFLFRFKAAGDERDSGQNQDTPMTRSTAMKWRSKRAMRPRVDPTVRAASRNQAPRSVGSS